jgi:hypothetical protein
VQTSDNPEEALAQAVVEALDDVRLELTDVRGAPDGTCDFAVWRDGKHPGALEVTMLVEESRARFDGTLYAEPILEATNLTGTWYVALSDDAVDEPKALNVVRLKVVRALAELEAGGIREFTRDEMRPYRIMLGIDEERPSLLIDDLPVNFAQRSDMAQTEPRVFLLGPASGGRVSSDNAHATIEEALAGPAIAAKVRKLNRTNVRERHLFIWIGISLFEARSESPRRTNRRMQSRQFQAASRIFG